MDRVKKQDPSDIQDEVGIVRLTGEVDVASAARARQMILTALELHDYRIVVDMKQVTYLDSSGISALIAGLKTARENGGNLGISGMPNRIQNVMRLTGLDKLFPVFADEVSAFRFLSEK